MHHKLNRGLNHLLQEGIAKAYTTEICLFNFSRKALHLHENIYYCRFVTACGIHTYLSRTGITAQILNSFDFWDRFCRSGACVIRFRFLKKPLWYIINVCLTIKRKSKYAAASENDRLGNMTSWKVICSYIRSICLFDCINERITASKRLSNLQLWILANKSLQKNN